MYNSKMFWKIPSPGLRVLPSLTTSSPALPQFQLPPGRDNEAITAPSSSAPLNTQHQHLNKLFPKNTTFIGDDMRLIVVMV